MQGKCLIEDERGRIIIQSHEPVLIPGDGGHMTPMTLPLSNAKATSINYQCKHCGTFYNIALEIKYSATVAPLSIVKTPEAPPAPEEPPTEN